MEDRLRVLEQALRFAQVGLYRYRADGTLVAMNAPAFAMLELGDGVPGPDALLGRRLSELISDVRPRVRVRELFADHGEARDLLFSFRTLSGSEKWVLHNAFPMIDPATGERLVQAVVKDVTHAHRLGEALRESELRLERVVQTVAEGVMILDLGGRIRFANDAAGSILGLPREELLGRTYHDERWKVSAGDGSAIADADLPVAFVLRTGQPIQDRELELDRPPDGRINLHVNCVPFRDERGAMTGVVTTIRDITASKRLERLREEFLATAAHELNTPVAAIKGYVQLLRRGSLDADGDAVRTALAAINRQCNRIDRLVSDLLELSHQQLAPRELACERLDLAEVAREVLASMQELTERHLLTLESAGPVWTRGDPGRIEHVLVNLLSNAIRFSPAGGVIVVRVEAAESEARVSVTDSGIGIPAHRQDAVFERFHRAHAGTDRDYGGLGMGLYVSREVVRGHGGRIWFESEEGRGSTFHVALPLVAAPVAKPVPRDRSGSRAAGSRGR